MKKFYLLITCSLIMLNAAMVNAQRSTNELNIKYRLWLDTLKAHNGGENWDIKSVDELLNRSTSPYWVKQTDRKNYFDIPEGTTIGDYTQARRCVMLKRADLSNNNLTGILSNSPIYRWMVNGTSIESGIFSVHTQFLFSYNKLTDVTADILHGEVSSRMCPVLAFDHNQLTGFNPLYRSGDISLNAYGADSVWLNNNKLSKYINDWEQAGRGLWFIKSKVKFLRMENNLYNFQEMKKLYDMVEKRVNMKTKVNGKMISYRDPDFRFTYSPQLPLGDAVSDQHLNAGDNINLQFSLPDPNNKYIWELNGKEIPLSDGKNFIDQIKDNRAGMYRCKVTNTNLPELTIYSKAHMVFMNKAGNSAPTGFNINNTKALPNSPQWSVIGEFGGEDPDNDKLYFRLIDHEGDNADFRIIDGNTLVSSTILFEWSYKTEYTIRVQAYDIYGGTLDKEITITRGEATSPVPTGVRLSNKTIDENKVGDVGEFKLSGVETSDFKFQLNEEKDNRFFTVAGITLKTKIGLNYEKQRFYTVRVKAINGDVSITKDFVIEALNINDAPGNLLLTSNEIQIGKDPGTLIGILVGTDDDPDDTDFTYSTISENFIIKNKNQLQSKKRFTRADIGTLKIKVKVKDDEDAESEYNLDINVVDNPDPSEARVVLDNYIVSENITGKVGNLSVNQGGDFEYVLVSGEGSVNNDMFEIIGNELKIKESVNYEVVQQLNIRVKAGDDIETAIDITVENVNEAPTVIGLTNFIVMPDWGVGTEISTIVFGDEDTGKGLFTLGSDGDNSYFTIDQNILKLNKEIGDHGNKFAITITANDGEFEYSQEFDLYVPTQSQGTDIIDINDVSSARAYPNPVDGVLNVNISNSYRGDVKLDIYSLSGFKVIQKRLLKHNDEITETVNISDLPSGVYVLRINQGDQQSAVQIIKR